MDKKTERLIHLIKDAQEQYSEEYLVLAVPGFISKKFIAYGSMKEDLETLLQYIVELRKQPSRIIKSALSYSLISLYGKCFTDASSSNSPKLEPSNLFNEENDVQDTHKFLMELRHQFIAHRGETEHEIGISYMLVPKKGSLDKTQIQFSQLKMVSFSDEDLSRIEVLINFIITQLIKKIQKQGQKLHDGMLDLFSPEQLTFMIMNGAK